MAVKKHFQRLSEVDLDFVSLVVRGDDPMAKTVLHKSDPTVSSKKGRGRSSSSTIKSITKEGVSNMAGEGLISKEDLPDDVVDYIDTLEAVAEAIVKSTGATVEQDEDTGEVTVTLPENSDDDDDDDDGDDVTSKSFIERVRKDDPALADHLQKQADELKEAREAIAKSEDAALTTTYISKAEGLSHITKDAPSLGRILKSVAAHDTDLADQVEEVLKAANEQLKQSGLFATIGKTGEASDRVKDGIAALRKADPTLTAEKAEAKFYEENPDAYDEATTA